MLKTRALMAIEKSIVGPLMSVISDMTDITDLKGQDVNR